MSKVASYLQSHIVGELTTRKDVREQFAHDGSVLEQTPEIVAYPRTTNDIRKIARFSWQLAEKGHGLPITPRGAGTDPTGAAIGQGVSIVTTRHMHRVFEYDSKQKLLRLQPGASVESVENALRLHGVTIPAFVDGRGTVGGEIASNHAHRLTAKYGRVSDSVDKLEIVLDDGEVIQTGRINKRELSKRKGWQGREGDIYRGIDAVLEDHAELIASIQRGELIPQGGYPGIADVRAKDGSVDLAPLFIGSQGTLGIISEAILRTTFVPAKISRVAVAFKSAETARDTIDALISLTPAYVEYYDGRLLSQAISEGNSYEWLGELSTIGAVVLFGFDDFNERARQRQMKKALRILQKLDKDVAIATTDTHDGEMIEAVRAIADPTSTSTIHADQSMPPLVEGFFVPQARFEDFLQALATLEAALHTDLPIYGSPITGHFSLRPTLSLHKVSDKQKVFKLIDQLNALLIQYEGDLVAGGSEGRLLSRFVRASWSEEYTQMVDEIKRVFDPHGILNPGVKTPVELRELVTQLRSDNSIGIS